MKESLTIVHVITRMIRGGADENTMLSCNAQAEAGHKVHLIYGGHASEEMLAKAHSDVQLHCVSALVRPLSPLSDIRALTAIFALVRKLSPDIVHTHTSKAGILGRLAAWLAGAKGIVHGVHILPFLNVGRAERAVYLTAERMVAPVTKAFVSVSSGMRDACLSHRIGAPSDHYVVPSGMDIHAFLHAEPLDGNTVSAALPLTGNEDCQLVLMVAALEPRKRIFEFLSVFLQVLESQPSAKLVVLGEGVDRTRIETEIRRLGLVGKVFLAGFRPDVERWIASAKVCVLSSEREGLPRAIIQYAAGACPCVVTDLPGVEVVVKHGETGFLVDSNSLESMVEPIVRILEDRELAKTLRANAGHLDLLPWSVENMTAQLEAIYRHVLALPLRPE